MEINIEKNGNEAKKRKSAAAFNRMFNAVKRAALPVVCTLAITLASCGGDEKPVISSPDQGYADAVEVADVGTQQCQFRWYAVLKVDGEMKVVEYGNKVKVGSKEYTVKDTENDGPILQKGDEIYVISTDTPVNGKSVSYLGEGTRQIDSVFMQVEYADGEVSKDFKTLLTVGDSDKISVDKTQYVESKLHDVIKTDKGLEYAVLSVKLFVKSTEGSDTYIASKTLENITVPIDSAVPVVLDETTGLVMNLDTLASGTSDAKMVLSVNGEEVKLGKDGVWEGKIGETKVELKGKGVLHSPDFPSGSLQITVPDNNEVVLTALMKGEVLRIDLGDDGMLRIELTGSEPNCKSE